MPQRLAVVLLGLSLVLLAARAQAGDQAAETRVYTEQSLDFDIHWPPQVPGTNAASSSPPLLRGKLSARILELPDEGQVIRFQITLERPHDDAAREYWNARLAFPEYGWMQEVRTWDAGHQWLWPNLPYLLRLHGRERVERYGGTDPGKGIDDDFAAVLIRKYDAKGETETDDSKRAPLVSAEWRPAGIVGQIDRQTVIHTARSDEFTVHLSSSESKAAGKITVWLIYADFLGTRPPREWPQTPEFSGGILAFFEADWERLPGAGFKLVVTQKVPPRGTDFDWSRLSLRARLPDGARLARRLTDAPMSPTPTLTNAPAGIRAVTK